MLLQHSPSPIGSTRMLQLMTINMFAVHNSQLKGKQYVVTLSRQRSQSSFFLMLAYYHPNPKHISATLHTITFQSFGLFSEICKTSNACVRWKEGSTNMKLNLQTRRCFCTSGHAKGNSKASWRLQTQSLSQGRGIAEMFHYRDHTLGKDWE